MSPETLDVVKAVVAALATLGVAALGLIGVIYSARKPSKDKPPVGNTGKALQEFNGTQNEFMALVIADNGDLRRQQAEMNMKLEGLNDHLARQNEEIAAVKRHSETFLGAVRRYLMKLATAWTGADPMPWPDEEDFHILEDTLPHKRPGTIIRREK